MSRHPRWPLILLAAAHLPLAAQESGPPQRIDLLAEAEAAREASYEECSQAEKDAAAISGEIVVCSRRSNEEHRLTSREAAQERYARETMYAGDPQAPDVAGAGIFRGPATIGGLCIPGLQKCPPPPAYVIDFDALPDAPAGSDADRISRGLPPLGQDAATPAPTVNRAESASPEAER